MDGRDFVLSREICMFKALILTVVFSIKCHHVFANTFQMLSELFLLEPY